MKKVKVENGKENYHHGIEVILDVVKARKVTITNISKLDGKREI